MENSSKVLGNVANNIFEMSLHHYLSIQKKVKSEWIKDLSTRPGTNIDSWCWWLFEKYITKDQITHQTKTTLYNKGHKNGKSARWLGKSSYYIYICVYILLFLKLFFILCTSVQLYTWWTVKMWKLILMSIWKRKKKQPTNNQFINK